MKPESLAKMKKLKEQARQRIIERGKIEFRVEPELMSALLDLAHKTERPLGPMIRDWVKDRLQAETGGKQAVAKHLQENFSEEFRDTISMQCREVIIEYLQELKSGRQASDKPKRKHA
jgi:hypothetical protein